MHITSRLSVVPSRLPRPVNQAPHEATEARRVASTEDLGLGFKGGRLLQGPFLAGCRP